MQEKCGWKDKKTNSSCPANATNRRNVGGGRSIPVCTAHFNCNNSRQGLDVIKFHSEEMKDINNKIQRMRSVHMDRSRQRTAELYKKIKKIYERDGYASDDAHELALVAVRRDGYKQATDPLYSRNVVDGKRYE